MSGERSFGVEIQNQRKVLENLAEAGSRGQNAEAVLRAMRKLWSIIMDTEFIGLDPKIVESLKSSGDGRIGMDVAHDLRRVSVLERYFRTRGRGFLPYIGYHHGALVFLRRGENLDYIGELHTQIDKIALLLLEKLDEK